MKLRLRLSIPFLLLLTLPSFSGTSNAQSQAVITESKVLAMINSVDRASRKGNVAGILAPLAEDVKIKMSISTPASDKEQVFNFNKEQFAFHLRRGLRRRLTYQLQRKNTRVKIYNDGKTAMVSGELYETLTIPQGTLRAVSSEVAILNLRDDKIVVTSIDSRTRFY